MLVPAAALANHGAGLAYISTDVLAGKGGNELKLLLVLKLAVFISTSYNPQEQNQSLFAS